MLNSQLKILTLIGGIGLCSISTYAQSAPTVYDIDEQHILQQIDQSSLVAGYSPLSYIEFSLVEKVDTGGANLSAAPTVEAPNTKTITFPTGANASPLWPSGFGYNRYQAAQAWTSQAALTSAAGSGNFIFTLGDATAQPTLPLNTISPQLPVTPMLTSGGIWSENALHIDPNTGATLTFNSSSFGSYATGLGGQIKFELFNSTTYPEQVVTPLLSDYIPSVGKFDAALNALVIAPGELTAGQTYILQANFAQIEALNTTTTFTGTGISGSPIGASYYTGSTFITIDTSPVPLPPAVWLFVSGLLGIVGFARRKKTSDSAKLV